MEVPLKKSPSRRRDNRFRRRSLFPAESHAASNLGPSPFPAANPHARRTEHAENSGCGSTGQLSLRLPTPNRILQHRNLWRVFRGGPVAEVLSARTSGLPDPGQCVLPQASGYASVVSDPVQASGGVSVAQVFAGIQRRRTDLAVYPERRHA